MENMKNSGVEWIGMIPKEWNTSFMKYDCNKITDYTASGSFASLAENVEYLDEPDYAMLVRTADLSQKREMNSIYINQHSYEFLKNSNLFGGEIILSNIGSVGEVFLYKPLYEKSSLAPNAIMAVSKYDNRYLYYYLLSPTVNEELKSLGGNAVQSKFNKTQLRQFKCITPLLKEQQIIADFLDNKVGKIDEILANLNEQVNILQKYKKSLITKVVTKGTNFNVPMKKSGIEWIGEIPGTWKCQKLKYLLKNPLMYGANESGEDFNEEYPRYIRITDIDENNKLKEDGKLSLLPDVAKPYILKEGDILFARSGATVGKTFIYKEEYGKSAFAGYLIKADINEKLVLPQYVYYSTLGVGYDNWKNSVFTQATIQNIGADKYALYIIPVPPIIEQQRIVDYLDKKCFQIDELIKDKQTQIEKMEKYKKSLIYEYVTGKKRVKGAEELYG